VQGLDEARRLGATDANPAIHPIQAAAVAPLARAYERLAHRLDDDAPSPLNLNWAARHRSAFMWPWETEPHGIATGILDVETYDWLAVVRGTIASGGSPVVVDEATLLEANEMARQTTGIDVDPTGTAGLAGLLDLRRRALVAAHETVAVIFTGVSTRYTDWITDERRMALAGPDSRRPSWPCRRVLGGALERERSTHHDGQDPGRGDRRQLADQGRSPSDGA
jgi:threonine synthase